MTAPHATGRFFSMVSSTHKTERHDITEILLKVALSIATHPPYIFAIFGKANFQKPMVFAILFRPFGFLAAKYL
jgi:hypothetical protein